MSDLSVAALGAAQLAPPSVPVPSAVSALEATFTSLASPGAAGGLAPAASPGGSGPQASGPPTDPFDVLLSAAGAQAPTNQGAAGALAALAQPPAAPGSPAGPGIAPAGPGIAPAGPGIAPAGSGSSSELAALAPASTVPPPASGPTAGVAGNASTGGTAPATGSAAAAVEAATSSPGATASGVAVVADATRYLGVPYLWGGTSPQTGFDCSGLVQHVFADLGVSLPRTSYEQVFSGTPVASLTQAQPGDLLFFEPGQNGAGPGLPGHVAIYIGNNEMIAAPETGQTVQVQQVPVTPLAIRRVTVPSPPGASSLPAPAGAPASAGAPVPAGGSLSIGGVSIPAAYAPLVQTSAAASGVPASLLAAVLQTESGFDPSAVSSAGAQGIAQFMPGTAASLGVNPFDPSSAIPGAARYLAQLESQLGSWQLAVAAYNAGPAAVQQAGGVPQNGQTPTDVATVLARAGLRGSPA